MSIPGSRINFEAKSENERRTEEEVEEAEEAVRMQFVKTWTILSFLLTLQINWSLRISTPAINVPQWCGLTHVNHA